MAKKVLVVGATSKVGSELVRALAADGESVRAATRHPGDYRAAPGVEAVGFDYDYEETMMPALEGVDRLFMLSKWTQPRPEFTLNRFIEHARTAGVERVVYMTALGMDLNPAVGQALVEKRVAGSGMGYTLLHPNWLMQNFSRGFLFPRIREIGMITVPAGNAKVSFVDARDVAEVAKAALNDPTHQAQVYHLTGGQGLSYGEVAEILATALGRPVTYRTPDEDEFRDILRHGFEPEQAEYLNGLFAYVRDNQVADVDPTLERLLGRPPTSFEAFARDHAQLWR